MGRQWGRCGGDGVRFARTMRASRYNADPARVAKSVTAVDLKSGNCSTSSLMWTDGKQAYFPCLQGLTGIFRQLLFTPG